ncbi:MAG: hypothetical protein SOT28_08695 [Fusicatenibacter sp.]|nr:hypothetical protein [Lachnospiraceae bacterium]MDY2938369.1 hypothetical protein [Fusicatenibacter sp.]
MKKKIICAVLVGCVLVHGSGMPVRAAKTEPASLWNYRNRPEEQFPSESLQKEQLQNGQFQNGQLQKEQFQKETEEWIRKIIEEIGKSSVSEEWISPYQEKYREEMEKVLEEIKARYPELWAVLQAEETAVEEDKKEEKPTAAEQQEELAEKTKDEKPEEETKEERKGETEGEIKAGTEEETEEETEIHPEVLPELSAEVQEEAGEVSAEEQQELQLEELPVEDVELLAEDKEDEIVIPVRKTAEEIIGSGKEKLLEEIVPELPKVRLIYEETQKVTPEYQPVIRMENSEKAEIVSCMINGVEADYHWENNEICISPEGLAEGNNRITVTVKDKTGEICEMEPWEFQVEEDLLASVQGTETEETDTKVKSTAAGWFGRYLEVLKKLLMCTFHRGVFF